MGRCFAFDSHGLVKLVPQQRTTLLHVIYIFFHSMNVDLTAMIKSVAFAKIKMIKCVRAQVTMTL